MDKTQFKFDDLDVHEIVGNLPVVLHNSPILYAYIMMIHLSRIQHAGVDVTIKAVSNRMYVPEKLGIIVKRIRTNCSSAGLY